MNPITDVSQLLSIPKNQNCPPELLAKITNLATSLVNSGVQQSIQDLPIENDNSIENYNSLLIYQAVEQYSALVNTLGTIVSHEFYGEKNLTEPPEDPIIAEQEAEQES